MRENTCMTSKKFEAVKCVLKVGTELFACSFHYRNR